MKTGLLSAGLMVSALALSGFALSQGGPASGAGLGGGYGPGMMGGGYGPGMMGGGYGPGMMGGGYGPGMMGGGYGPGMMGGGYGPGMMGGGYGPGMMGGGYAGMIGGAGMGGYAALDLTDDQRQKLAALGEQARRKSWDAMGQLRAEQYRLQELLRADPVNATAVVDQQVKVDDIRRQVLKARIDARNEMAGVLTADQRKRVRESGPWWYREDAIE